MLRAGEPIEEGSCPRERLAEIDDVDLENGCVLRKEEENQISQEECAWEGGGQGL